MRTYNLLYVANYAVMSIHIEAEEDWTEDVIEKAGFGILSMYVKDTRDFHLDEMRECE